MDFKSNDIAIVIGGTSGLGKETAKSMRAIGLNVLIAGRCEEKGRIAADETGAIFHKIDVGDYNNVYECFNNTVTEDINLRVMVNCAGFTPAQRLLSKNRVHQPELFIKSIKINLLGALFCSSVAASFISKSKPMDADQQRGVIINTSSAASYDGQLGQVAYAASKGGINSMTLPMARDLSEYGIRVCTIAPGLFDTPLVSDLDANVKNSLHAQTAFPKRHGLPKEFARMVIHILENTMLNGEIIRLDGGLRMSIS